MSSLLGYFVKKKFSNRILYSGILINKRSFVNHPNIITSNLPDIEIPNNKTISEFAFQNINKYPHKIAVECGITGKKYTYEELRIKSINLNKALRKKFKLQKRDAVAVLLPNVPEYPICILGSIEAGLTVTTINPSYTPEEIKKQLLDADVKAIFTLTKLFDNVKAAINLAQKKIPVVAIKFQESDVIPESTVNFNEMVDTKCDIEDIVLEYNNDTILMPYSSGTTGLPKGVEQTHRSVIATVCQINSYHLKVSEDTTESHQDVVPAVLPWFHIYGLTVVLMNKLHRLSKLISLPQFTPELFINCLQRHRPHLLYSVPPLVIFMMNHPSVKKEYLESTRTVMSGAAPLGSLDEKKFLDKFGNHVSIIQGYGLTEACVVVVGSKTKNLELGLSGSVGEVLPNTSVKVVPADNALAEPLGPHKPGELLIKGPQVMKGYYNKSKETVETFVDGWMRTGDLVYYDENKMFYVADRLKELIKVKGFQVAPAELEQVLRSYPDVADAAVIGIPDDVHGEVPRAYVIPKVNCDINVKKLNEFINEKVADFKQIKGGISVVEGIPKTASGKILRRELRRQYENK